MTRIPFNKPYITRQGLKYMQDALQRNQISGDGYYTKMVSEFMEKTFQAKKVMMTTSCSSALDMAAMLLDLKEGDEVIMPSFTFVSTANAVMLRGAKPVFAEIDEVTLNISPEDIERKITSRTKAIFPVHYAGVACDMDRISDIARQHGLKIVEDAAQGVNARYKGRYLGTIGDLGCYSFHETKNYTCGEGGALLINSDDKKLVERAEIIREKGTNRSKFYRKEIDKYTWVDVGSSYLPSDMLSALLYSQLENLNEIQEMRKRVYQSYYNGLLGLQENGLLRLPVIPEECESNYHIFHIIMNSVSERDILMDGLKSKDINAVFHYIPLHCSPVGKRLGYSDTELPVTRDLSERLLRLPIFPELEESSINYILDSIKEIIRYEF